MPLSKKAIFTAIKQGALKLEPFSVDQVDEVHIDLHFGGSTKGEDIMTIPSLGFGTALTEETVTFSDQICGYVQGRTSLATAGISVEQSSHFVEPGTNNKMTLELFNASEKPYTIQRGQRIAKLIIEKITDTF